MSAFQGTAVSAAASRSPAPLRCRDGSRPRVLLAEDSAAARVLTAALLNRMGCDVDAVEHGEEALAAVQSYSYDLVILDIEMPVMDGIVAAKEIKALGGKAARTPIVALSAFLADARKASVWESSFTAELAKPAGRDDLRDAVQSVLSGETVAPRNAPAGAAAAAAEYLPVVDTATLNTVRQTVDRDTWRSLIDTAVLELEIELRDAALAGATRDREAIRANAHKISGISSSFGARRLADMASALEIMVLSRPEEEILDQLARMRACLAETIELLKATQPV